MYDIDTKNVKKGKKFFYMFFGVGILFLFVFGGIFISNIIKANSLDSNTTSTKVEVKSYVNDEGMTMYYPIYHYEVNGKKYSCSSNSSSSINPGTQNKTVYYDSTNPSNCMTEYSKSYNYSILVSLLIPIIFIAVAVINIRKINKRFKVIEELNQRGKLVKNLPYRLENTGMEVNSVPIQRPVIDYTLPSGSCITLYGDPRHDRKFSDADGMVDLLIDESNPNNYYIDFEINRLTGNLPQDYNIQNQQINSFNQNSQEQQIFNETQMQQSNENINNQQNM